MRRTLFFLFLIGCHPPSAGAPPPVAPPATPAASASSAPMPAARPVANLAPLWRVADAEARENWAPRLYRGSALYVDDDRGLYARDLRSGVRFGAVPFDARLLGFGLDCLVHGDLLVGSTTQGVLKRSRCPVMVLPMRAKPGKKGKKKK